MFYKDSNTACTVRSSNTSVNALGNFKELPLESKDLLKSLRETKKAASSSKLMKSPKKRFLLLGIFSTKEPSAQAFAQCQKAIKRQQQERGQKQTPRNSRSRGISDLTLVSSPKLQSNTPTVGSKTERLRESLQARSGPLNKPSYFASSEDSYLRRAVDTITAPLFRRSPFTESYQERLSANTQDGYSDQQSPGEDSVPSSQVSPLTQLTAPLTPPSSGYSPLQQLNNSSVDMKTFRTINAAGLREPRSPLNYPSGTSFLESAYLDNLRTPTVMPGNSQGPENSHVNKVNDRRRPSLIRSTHLVSMGLANGEGVTTAPKIPAGPIPSEDYMSIGLVRRKEIEKVAPWEDPDLEITPSPDATPKKRDSSGEKRKKVFKFGFLFKC